MKTCNGLKGTIIVTDCHCNACEIYPSNFVFCETISDTLRFFDIAQPDNAPHSAWEITSGGFCRIIDNIDSEEILNIMPKDRKINAENWLVELFGEMISRGLREDEHLHFKDSPIDQYHAPSIQELKDVNIRSVAMNMYMILQSYLQQIVADYERK